MKFEEIWPRGFREVVQRCERMNRRMDRRTDDRQGVITIAHPEPLTQVS